MKIACGLIVLLNMFNLCASCYWLVKFSKVYGGLSSFLSHFARSIESQSQEKDDFFVIEKINDTHTFINDTTQFETDDEADQYMKHVSYKYLSIGVVSML